MYCKSFISKETKGDVCVCVCGGIMVRGHRGSEKSEIFESKENKIKE